MLKKLLKRYSFFLITVAVTLFILQIYREVGKNAFEVAGSSFKQMLEVLPPIMILLGLMDVWISRERMMKYMGKDSGALGVFLSIILGSIGAGPMYAAFPFTSVLLKKGVRLSNVVVFMNAWCVTKIPTVLFEVNYLGYEFTFLRLAINLPGIILMGYILERLMKKEEIEGLY